MRIVYLVVGSICLALGSIGVVVPVLPTVPFFLVTAFCYARSSEKLNNWFKSTKLYKNNLETYVKGEGLTITTKVKIIGMVTCLLIISFIVMRNVFVGQICIIIVWLFHLWYFMFHVKTIEKS